MSPVARRYLTALALVMTGTGVLASARASGSILGVTFGLLLWAAGIAIVLTSLGGEDRGTWLRLDVYLPVLRRAKPGRREPFGIASWVRRFLPSAWVSNRETKQRGLVRRWLRSLGMSWLAAPLRRLSQAVCLGLFLILFFVVCWPYGARPAGEGVVIDGWRFQELDQATGRFRLGSQEGRFEGVVGGSHWYLGYEETGEPEPVMLGEVRVVEAGASAVELESIEPMSAEMLTVLLTGSPKYRLSEGDPTAWPSHYADHLIAREWIPAETFLVIDPLVSLSTAIASRSWVWSLTSAGVILLVCVLIPRGFCGYVCPLGTTIDLFDWAIAGRVKRFRVGDEGWWVHLKYYLLTGVLVSATMGVLLSGFVSAIPVVTRAMLFLLEPLQSGMGRGWHLVPAINWGHGLSIALFVLVLCLGFLRPRFWCKYVCPSGAVFSLGNLFRVSQRHVESSCIHCNKCVEICPFDAIKPDFTTRTTDCTLCQTCAGVCPTHAIKFVERWNLVELKPANDPPTGETRLGRRGFLSAAVGSAAALAGGGAAAACVKATGARLDDRDAFLPVRPPGSVPEEEFLEMCIRCGECFKACPNNVLQPEGFQQGFEGLWAPMVKADWAGCEPSCHACGQVCPTGAIRALSLDEKRVVRMGLAVVDSETCLPLAGKEDCDLCVQECRAAGYDAIEYQQVGTEVDDRGEPIAGTGFLAPVVRSDACVGCGLCQTRCYSVNVKQRHVLSGSAIVVEAGEGKEDRLLQGSYVDRGGDGEGLDTGGEEVVPEEAGAEESDPFGLEGEDPFGLGEGGSETGVGGEADGDNPFGL